ncbi:MAG: LytR family transcriptional regulator [Anaerolineales bacterium]|nr:MAG: LytR family transcriptional regulator [Anaerolineales bacterium]
MFQDRRLAIATLVILIFMVGACTNFAGLMMSGAPGTEMILATLDPAATATATPFGPIAATETPPPPPAATATPLATPTTVDPWGSFPAPVEPSAIEIRRPMAPLQVPEGTINIMILGSDQRPYEYGHRTDTMMLLSLDPRNGTAKLLSFPRDLYVFIPGWRMDRINTADPNGGPERVAQTILYNFGLEVHHWVRANFWGFTQAIDTLGGINVQSGAGLSDECGGIQWNYGQGTYHMDGFTALCYVRMRHVTGDFDRMRRQQEVVLAIFNRVLSLDGLTRVPDLYSQFRSMVETDMEIDDILSLLPLAAKLSSDPSQIQRLEIGIDKGSLWRVPYSGASVILPEWEAIESMLHEAFETQP